MFDSMMYVVTGLALLVLLIVLPVTRWDRLSEL
jgi:hypothetical protein